MSNDMCATYYKENKEKILKKSRDRFQNFPKEEKHQKQRLVEYRKRYYKMQKVIARLFFKVPDYSY